jgi:hypothetical protein
MRKLMRGSGVWSVLLAAGFACAAGAQMKPAAPAAAPGIIPTGFGDAVDRDVARVRAATERFRVSENAIAAGYPRHSDCVANPPQGAMGFHFQNHTIGDAVLEVERPEVLVYEQTPAGGYTLTGVEYLVPITAWTRDEPPTIMGQKLKRAEKLGIWYLHVWIWKPNPSGLFADWNPDVKC